jgi:HrpA-like RNA helicase
VQEAILAGEIGVDDEGKEKKKKKKKQKRTKRGDDEDVDDDESGDSSGDGGDGETEKPRGEMTMQEVRRSLPVYAFRQPLLDAIRDNQILM